MQLNIVKMENLKRNIYKYNMSFYYQSTIIYLVVFLIYIMIRDEFVEGSYRLVTNDPIIYFFGIIVLVSIIALLYNLYKNRHLEISDDAISFVNMTSPRMEFIGLARSALTWRRIRTCSSTSLARFCSTVASPRPPLRARRISAMATWSPAGSARSRPKARRAGSKPCGPIRDTNAATSGLIAGGQPVAARCSAWSSDPTAPEANKSARRRVKPASD